MTDHVDELYASATAANKRVDELERQLRLAEMSNSALRNQVKTLKEQRTKNRRTIKKANDRIAGLVARLEAHGIPSKLSQNAELE